MALEIVMPRLSDSMEEGTILQWLVAEGDAVKPGQPLVEVETDKANVTYEADAAGVVLELTVGEGASVPVGAPIAVIGEAGEELPVARSPEAAAAAVTPGAAPRAEVAAVASGAAPRAEVAAVARGGGPARAEVATDTPTPAPRSGRAKASPLARRLAAERDVDLAALSGSGPNGRVIRADVERAATAGNNVAAASVPAPETAKGESTVQELSRGQATVARRMAESRATVPDIELTREVNMSHAVAVRSQLAEVSDPAPSYNDFIVRAVALALREFPRVNGAYRDSRFETYSRVNVGIAVAAPDALVVATIFDADTKSLAEIGEAARALASRVRDGSITPGELSGGTFTVSNLGMYGVDSFSAVINQPQAAILAVGTLRPRPIVDDTGAVVARPTVLLTLACDHRILYGADGARFLGRLRELLEQPLSLLV
jgi:pyruvate dehydrogenase E2 component (dihydrolipoamide acetyltransferase)